MNQRVVPRSLEYAAATPQIRSKPSLCDPESVNVLLEKQSTAFVFPEPLHDFHKVVALSRIVTFHEQMNNCITSLL